ncbi:MAG: putative SnoaL-like aldol condensation-catalyzing enzyme, partial [Saprospiraceae bacterium]
NIEHYSEAYQETNSKGVPTMAGQNQTLEVNKTGLYMSIVKSFMKKVAIGNSPNDILEGVNDDYLDHSAHIDGTGSTSLENRFVYDESSKTAFKFDYDKLERILGEGNFILVESKASLNSEDVTVLDLFRLDRNRICEHWDVVSR